MKIAARIVSIILSLTILFTFVEAYDAGLSNLIGEKFLIVNVRPSLLASVILIVIISFSSYFMAKVIHNRQFNVFSVAFFIACILMTNYFVYEYLQTNELKNMLSGNEGKQSSLLYFTLSNLKLAFLVILLVFFLKTHNKSLNSQPPAAGTPETGAP